MQKVSLLFAIMAVVFISSCKQIAGASIESSVEDLNERCPIRLGEVDVLNKVEYRNNAICFYLTEDEEGEGFARFTPEQKEKIENSLDFKRQAIGTCLTNDVVQEELNNVTETMADEVGLTFRVFVKGKTSKHVLKTELSWKQIQDLKPAASEW